MLDPSLVCNFAIYGVELKTSGCKHVTNMVVILQGQYDNLEFLETQHKCPFWNNRIVFGCQRSTLLTSPYALFVNMIPHGRLEGISLHLAQMPIWRKDELIRIWWSKVYKFLILNIQI